MKYRVDELAGRGGVSVDTVRFYQAKGLLEAPERDGRLAYYSDDHLRALGRIRDLKAQGFSLASIKRFLAGELDAADEALVAVLARPPTGAGGPDDEALTLDELAERTGVSPALLVAIEREGLLTPEVRDGAVTYSTADAGAVAAGLQLLEAGLPLAELLDLARAHDRAVRPVVERAVELFDLHVRRPLRDSATDSEEAGRRLVEAFTQAFEATTALVAHRFGRLLLESAQQRVGGDRADHDERADAQD
jgi:DNA-binding transcriptional MerR regulator